MRVLVLGAGGIVGQHMTQKVPDGVDAMFIRRNTYKGIYHAADLESQDETIDLFNSFKPDTIVNLAGVNEVDVVESDPEKYYRINVGLPLTAASWCDSNNKQLVHASTQGVFSGENAPYDVNALSDGAVNEYGKQKALVESHLIGLPNVSVPRLTFVLGVRPYPELGRMNPLEHMLAHAEQAQVYDRYFSTVFASDAAKVLWTEATKFEGGDVFNVGEPNKTSRYDIACAVAWVRQSTSYGNTILHKVGHEAFKGIAARPKDTSYKFGSEYYTKFQDGITDLVLENR